MFTMIKENFFKFDFIIVILGLLNLFIYLKVKKTSVLLKKDLRPTFNLSLMELEKSVIKPSENHVSWLQEKHKQFEDQEKYLYLFGAINSSFTLLGILGTVLSLLRITVFESELVRTNFTLALTSTMWGLAFALIYKMVEGFIVSVTTQNEKDLNLIRERIDKFDFRDDDNEK